MKISLKTPLAGMLASAVIGSLGLSLAQAADAWDYRWNGGGANTYWERSNAWLDASGTTTTAYPNGNGIYAYFSKETPLGAQQFITLSGQVTLGRLDIGNVDPATSGTVRRFNLVNGEATSGTEGFLYFTGWNGGNAQINELAGIRQGDIIGTAIKLGASLDVGNASNFTLSFSNTLSSATAGQKTVTLNSGKLFINYLEDGAGTISLVNSGGILTVDNAYHSGGVAVNNGGTLTISNAAYSGNSFIGATSTLAYTGILDLFAGNIEAQTGSNLVFNTAETGSYNAIISGGGDVIKRSGGHLTLTGYNTYTGKTIIEGGAVKIASDANLGIGGNFVFNNSGWAQLEFTANTTLNRTIELNGSSAALFGVGDGLTATLAGAITGTGDISKRYAGTLVLDGSGVLSGNVTVAAGTLIINGNYGNSTGHMLVVSTTSVGGSGSFGGTAQINGTISPTGILTLGSTTISSLSSFVVELGKVGGVANNGKLRVVGDVIIGISANRGSNLELSLGAGSENISIGDIFFLILNEGANSIVGQFYSLNGVQTALGEGDTFSYNGITFAISYLADEANNAFSGGNDAALQVIAIPEPSIAVGLLCGSVLLWVVRRRRHV